MAIMIVRILVAVMIVIIVIAVIDYSHHGNNSISCNNGNNCFSKHSRFALQGSHHPGMEILNMPSVLRATYLKNPGIEEVFLRAGFGPC